VAAEAGTLHAYPDCAAVSEIDDHVEQRWRGLARRQPEVVPDLGIDEESFLKRHQYVSVVGDLDDARILHVADERKAVSVIEYFGGLDEAQRTGSRRSGTLQAARASAMKGSLHRL